MKSNFFRPSARLAILLCFSSSIAHAGSTGKSSGKTSTDQAPTTSSWQWSVKAGTAYRHFRGVDFRTPAYWTTPSWGMHPFPHEQEIGPATAFANRQYRNGFVFMDDATANPESFLPGTTAYWGYGSAAQVQGGEIVFNTGEYVYQSSELIPGPENYPDNDGHRSLDSFAPVLEVEALYSINDQLRLGGTFGFMFTPLDSNNRFGSLLWTTVLRENTYTVTDRYDLVGVIPPVAPYAGTLAHPGTAPLINNLPSSRTITDIANTTQSVGHFYLVEQAFDLDLSTLSLGPTIEWEHGRFAFSGRFGLAVNIASWDAGSQVQTYNESAGLRSQPVVEGRSHGSGTDIVPGFFIQAAAAYQINDNWSVSVFGRRDWTDSFSETLDSSPGPFFTDPNFSVDLSGYTIGATITKNF